jgi:hypothetical protein
VSNVLAVAAVTSTLRYVLDRAIQADRPGPVGGANVTTVRPGDLATGDLAQAAGINVWCYLATPNHAVAADDLPARRPDGSLAGRPVAALDLHYLLTFYGDDGALETQRLLARAALALRTTSVLTRDVVALALAHYAARPETAFLDQSDLGNDVELVKLAPTPLSLEEMSKLWAVLDTPYLLSLTYIATAVVVTSSLVPAAAPPVASRVLEVGPATSPRVVDVLVDAALPGEPASAGARLLVRGSGLLPGTGTASVRVGATQVPPAEGSTAAAVTVTLPPEVPAGTHLLSVRHATAAGPGGAPPRVVAVSNAVPLVVRPSLTSVSSTAQTVTLEVSPAVRAGQDVRLLLTRLVPAGPDDPGELTFAFPSLSADAPPASALTVDRDELLPGTWLVRLQVDGVQSKPEMVDEVYAKPVLELA